MLSRRAYIVGISGRAAALAAGPLHANFVFPLLLRYTALVSTQRQGQRMPLQPSDQANPLHSRAVVIIIIVIIIINIIILSILLGCVLAHPHSGGADDSAEARTLEALRSDYSTRP